MEQAKRTLKLPIGLKEPLKKLPEDAGEEEAPKSLPLLRQRLQVQ